MGRVAVLHPDLGLGGAERLIVDACKALQERKHQVTLYTGYFDPHRCFEETRDGTIHVITLGSWIPRSILGRCHALIAYLKMILIALYLLIFQTNIYDLIICDQVSACIPFLKMKNYLSSRKIKIIFYCHFPDLLLTKRESYLKALYRLPIDAFEEWSTSLADIILVNSKFTLKIVQKTFKSLKDRDLRVLYPCVDVNHLTKLQLENSISMDKIIGEINCDLVKKCYQLSKTNYIFISLNRFERKKNLSLAIEALYECKESIGSQSMKAHLIIAGGYDERLIESLQYYEELKRLVNELELSSYVTFVRSPSDKQKVLLLQMSNAVLYTPEEEHFGIVPLEAMALSKPVISCNSGGPLETVEHDVTGYLCDGDKHSFAQAMLKLNYNKDVSTKLGEAGYERVRKHFSCETFGDRLNGICFPSPSS